MVAGAGGMVFGTIALALFLYSPVARRYPLAKDVYAAGLCTAPLYYGALVGGTTHPWTSYAVLAGFVLGREILMDGAERTGDIQGGSRTIAALAGRNRSMQTGAACMLVS